MVWLALHASREAALAKRLEEDYGYKSAIASSFLGFHKQMAEIGSAAESNKPLAKLCGDVLTTMASPPVKSSTHKRTPDNERAGGAPRDRAGAALTCGTEFVTIGNVFGEKTARRHPAI